MSFKKLLGAFEIDRRSGYSIVDVVRVFKTLSKRPMGRILLMEKLGLGEATVKTMIKNLRKYGFTRGSSMGEMLTIKGKNISKYLEERISEAFKIEIPFISRQPTIALVVRNASKKVKMGIEQRDEGMKMGAHITTLVFHNKQVRFPGTGEVVRGLEHLGAKEGDAIIIASGENLNKAERGGIAAAMTFI